MHLYELVELQSEAYKRGSVDISVLRQAAGSFTEVRMLDILQSIGFDFTTARNAIFTAKVMGAEFKS